jgi:hypothetical protein
MELAGRDGSRYMFPEGLRLPPHALQLITRALDSEHNTSSLRVFNIRLESGLEKHDEGSFYRGIITLGSFSEDFLASASLWTAATYERQWQSAVRDILGPAACSAFITSFVHPDASINVLWPAWRVGDAVRVQNRLVLREHLSGVLDPGKLPALVGERPVATHPGHAISEWVVSAGDLASFAV